MWYYNEQHPLRRYFSGLTEQTFLDVFGVGDPPLTDYLSLLLARFIHMDAVHRLHKTTGKPLDQVVDMILEVEDVPAEGRTSREVHRHIGDFTLFWTGVYPEALKKLQSMLRKDHFVNYCEQGKRSYYIASTFEEDPYRDEAPVLRRISERFEMCAYGLTRVRQEWQNAKTKDAGLDIE